MAKDDLIELTGSIEEVLPGSMFRVKIDNMNNMNNVIICYTSGKLKKHKIKIIQGDRVKVEVSAYDLTKGRVTYRL
jgi:translation initiation factor IF-1